jgi:hypothetical protein
MAGALTGVQIVTAALVLDRVPTTVEVAVCEQDVCARRTLRQRAPESDSGNRGGFADFERGGMEPEADRVRIRLFDHTGGVIAERTVAVKPRVNYPNGKRCGPRGVYAEVSVAADGTVSAQ